MSGLRQGTERIGYAADLVNPVLVVRKHPLTSFFVLSCLFGWYAFVVELFTGGSGAENLPLGPVIATVVVASCQGRQELRSWARRVRSWRGSPGWYLLALAAPIAVTLLIVLANAGLGAPLPTADQLAEWPQVPGTFLVMLVFVGIGEDAGWMAFAAPILLQRYVFLTAFALVAAMRTLWHLPMLASGDLGWVLGTVGNVAFSMVALLLVAATSGRWALVAVWHAALNATSGLFFFTMVTGEDRDRLSYLMAGAYALLALVGYLAWTRRTADSGAAPLVEAAGAAR